MAWKLFEHEKGLGIEASGFDAGEALDQAALALSCILTGEEEPENLGGEEPLEFYVHSPDLEELAMAFMNEMLWHHESKDVLWNRGSIRVEQTDEGGLEAQVAGKGIPFDEEVHAEGFDVTAVTYRELSFQQADDGWHLRVFLDI